MLRGPATDVVWACQYLLACSYSILVQPKPHRRKRGSASLLRRRTLMPGAKVLVVDDSWTDLTLIATPLRESGFEVITAVDGDEAMEKVLTERPQCVVLDVILPRRNGFQLCRQIKHMEQGRDIPIILMSSKNTPLDKRWGLQQGADLYLTKPFNRDELVASVRRLV